MVACSRGIAAGTESPLDPPLSEIGSTGGTAGSVPSVLCSCSISIARSTSCRPADARPPTYSNDEREAASIRANHRLYVVLNVAIGRWISMQSNRPAGIEARSATVGALFGRRRSERERGPTTLSRRSILLSISKQSQARRLKPPVARAAASPRIRSVDRLRRSGNDPEAERFVNLSDRRGFLRRCLQKATARHRPCNRES